MSLATMAGWQMVVSLERLFGRLHGSRIGIVFVDVAGQRLAQGWPTSPDRPRRKVSRTIGSGTSASMFTYCEPWPGNKKVHLACRSTPEVDALALQETPLLGLVLFESRQSGLALLEQVSRILEGDY